MPTARLVLATAFLLPGRLVSQTADTVANTVRFEVQYRGGHSGVKGSHDGVLILTDSAALFILRTNLGGDPALVIPYRKITDIGGIGDRKGASVGAKLLFGGFAQSSKDELVTVAYDDVTDAEAPVFKTKSNESAQLIAKIRFRMRKLGMSPVNVADSVKHPNEMH